MGGKSSVQLLPDESAEVATKTGFSVAQVNKLYHRYVLKIKTRWESNYQFLMAKVASHLRERVVQI